MRRITALALMLAASTLALATRAAAQPAADAVRALDARWARAYADHDTALALALFADDLVVTATNGSLKNRAGELADVRPFAGTKVEYFRSRDVNVRAYGDAAVVTGLLEWRLVTGDRTSDTQRRYTATWVRGGPHGWRMVALHVGAAPR